MEHINTDIPFKIQSNSIVIIKKLPVWQCGNCDEYLIEDNVMKKVDDLLSKIDSKVEVEILSYAA
jgi:YgiT-type zinc finger domain-containing protein